ncbi:hypothetical protein KFE25_005747 [Diacronema lutheri]|uniref:ATP-dependent Clp protease proteolytic subunit n=1 Tax=Diacronema lutheri TaxID=2081491 RepID=A0A8J5X2J4_DIALT|nr:hypothetical protein KFE25_005747 [Diacronema lutheri]|mmetsp:Transcript_2834/g.8757  ORF Transcript_2834/g.8757 Transcript_2834/m.8757 type:complete len:255 (+) Transcript_2834:1-765(+)
MAAFALTVVSALALVAPPARLGAPASRAGRGVPARPMAAARVAMGAINIDGVRIGPPPDLPSLLLHNRIVYVGTGLVPQVAELIVAQLLYIQFDSGDKPYFMYINSPGTASQDGMTGFETDAFAIADTMRYIRPEAQTICLGMAYGTAAMLLASGARGKRAMLPNAVAMLHQPRSRTQGQASDISLRAKEVLYNRRVLASLLAERCGRQLGTVEEDMGRTKYLTAEECKAYGLVDTVLQSDASLPAVPTFMNKL